MKSTCPKCQAKIELDVPVIPDDGTTTACPACKGSFYLYRESFAGRAFRKRGEISCLQCGDELGPSIHCPGCGLLYPEYVVASTSKSKIIKIKEIKETRSAKPTAGKGVSLPRPEEKREALPETEVSAKRQKIIKIIISLLILTAVAAGSFALYTKTQAEKKFAYAYVLALFYMKQGVDINTAICTKLATDWKTKAVPPRISAEDEARINKARTAVDKMIQTFNEPPAKFVAAKEQLVKINGIYISYNALTMAPNGTLASFSEASAKAQADFKKAAIDLKANMPERVSEELQAGFVKYRGFKELFM